MIKIVAFDLDNTLVDLADAHYHSLNQAISQIAGNHFVIQEDERAIYEGLPTLEKLQMLCLHKALGDYCINDIRKLKQKLTVEYIRENVVPDPEKIKIIDYCNKNNIQTAIVSNAVQQTVVLVQELMQLNDVDIIISNEHVDRTKPNPEPYLRAMINVGVGPRETIIFEDSPVGLKAAWDSGAHVIKVRNAQELTFYFFEDRIGQIV